MLVGPDDVAAHHVEPAEDEQRAVRGRQEQAPGLREVAVRAQHAQAGQELVPAGVDEVVVGAALPQVAPHGGEGVLAHVVGGRACRGRHRVDAEAPRPVLPPLRSVHLDAVVPDAPAQPVVLVLDRVGALGDQQEQEPPTPHGALLHHGRDAGQLVHALPQPLGVEGRPQDLARPVVHPEHERPTTRGVGEAPDLTRQVGSGGRVDDVPGQQRS